MEYLIDDTRPIFVQIAERIENDIIAGELPEESQVPSTNQFASFYQINPATAAKERRESAGGPGHFVQKARARDVCRARRARETAGEAPRTVFRAVRRADAPGGGKAGHHDGTGDRDDSKKG
jgi:DNA-binding transcriptional regulator YhcF (GntR family)